MIDQILSTKLAACTSEAEQRALVQHILSLLGESAPMQFRRVEWEGKKCALYQWGDVILVGGRLLERSNVHDQDGKLIVNPSVESPNAPRPGQVQRALVRAVNDEMMSRVTERINADNVDALQELCTRFLSIVPA